MSTFTESIAMVTRSCPSCAAVYAITDSYYQRRKEDGKSWHCPYCGNGILVADSENKRLKRELEAAEAKARAAKCAEMAERLKREEAESKLSKVKCRVKNGVCPCCNRSFTNLQRHMAMKHKDFKGVTTTPVINALDFNTPFDLAMALRSRAVAVPCVVRIGNELWTIQDYETGTRIAQGIMLATAPGCEKNTTIRTR